VVSKASAMFCSLHVLWPVVTMSNNNAGDDHWIVMWAQH
jgi:hypothetical protein